MTLAEAVAARELEAAELAVREASRALEDARERFGEVMRQESRRLHARARTRAHLSLVKGSGQDCDAERTATS
jgi:hypothetical protein